MDKAIKECKKKYTLFVRRIEQLEDEISDNSDKKDIKETKKELAKVEDSFDQFIINEYSRAIFEVYSKKQCKIKDIYTGEIKTWGEFFGSDFNKISVLNKECMVGLIEGYGAYRLK